jgi:hypothetical protein
MIIVIPRGWNPDNGGADRRRSGAPLELAIVHAAPPRGGCDWETQRMITRLRVTGSPLGLGGALDVAEKLAADRGLAAYATPSCVLAATMPYGGWSCRQVYDATADALLPVDACRALLVGMDALVIRPFAVNDALALLEPFLERRHLT